MKILCTNIINNYNVAIKKGLEEICYEGNSSIINKLIIEDNLFLKKLNTIDSIYKLNNTIKRQNNYISPIQCLSYNIDSRPFHYIPLIKLLSKFLALDRVQLLLKEH